MILKSIYGKLSFELKNRIEIDLGSGEGSFATELAKTQKNSLVIAVDSMRGRLEKLQKKASATQVENITIIESESGYFLSIMLDDEMADAIHLLCPDPWPKLKHRYHRIMSSEFSALICRKLKKNGIFHFSSDHCPYCDSAERIMSINPNFSLVAIPEYLKNLKTDFELQWIAAGKTVKHICWMKN